MLCEVFAEQGAEVVASAADLSEPGAARRVVFDHTLVPPQLQGRGIAAALISTALDWAADEGLQVVPACSYVAIYMRRHPETQLLLKPRD